MTVSGPLKKIKLFGMYKDIHCSAISEKSQNSAPSKNILTDPLSPDSSNLMNGHDACTISFYLMGEKKNFPIIWAKTENSNTEIDEGYTIKT